ncbi:MAG TPA: metallopeptidase TldD-related protein, partial [Patescibacteria group bacterium]|nr:metallopeptidase TldD-related protein [Patescibacteria group bacterium]
QALHPAEIDFAAVGERAAERAVKLLGSKRIATGRYPVVIDGTAFVDIVDLLAEALSAEMAVKGMSILAGKQGTRVAREAVSIIDDPFRRGCCFNAGFDAEGVPKKRCTLIESGILGGYLHNAYSSRRMGVKSSGNAVRQTYKNRPVPGPANLHIAPGERTGDEMIADMDEGVYVQDIMGIHTADTISGDFSVGINGFHIKGGRVEEPVSEVTMSGNILTLLCGIREVGSDLVFVGPLGSPTVSVEDISVSGT